MEPEKSPEKLAAAPIPAKSGALWIVQGWRLFLQQPMQLSGLFLTNIILTIFVGSIPYLGIFLPMILTPLLTMSLMTACALAERQQRIGLSVIATVLRAKALPVLLALGVLYLLAALLALLASRWVDDGLFWQVATGQLHIDPGTKEPPDFRLGMLSAFALYLPAALLFWYAAPLILWQKMSLAKALFYSFFSVWRARAAFVMYALTWFCACLFLPVFVISIFSALLGAPGLAMVIILPFLAISNVVLYCSFYPGYTQIFGQPDLNVL